MIRGNVYLTHEKGNMGNLIGSQIFVMNENLFCVFSESKSQYVILQ